MVICNGVDVDRASSWVISMETLGKVLLSQQGETADREHLVRIIMVSRDSERRPAAVRRLYQVRICFMNHFRL